MTCQSNRGCAFLPHWWHDRFSCLSFQNQQVVGCNEIFYQCRDHLINSMLLFLSDALSCWLIFAICSKSAGSYTLLHLIARILVKWGSKFVFMMVNRCSCLSTDSGDNAIANVADNLINDWFCIFRPCFW